MKKKNTQAVKKSAEGQNVNVGDKSKGKHIMCKLGLLVIAFCLGIGAYFVSGSLAADEVKQESATESPANQEPTLDEKVDKILAGMTDAEKVGQMVVIGVQGTVLDNDAAYMLGEYAVGGVILFDRNMESQGQVKELIDQLQANAHGTLPLFVAVDEEGGLVSRMEEALPPPPSQREIALTGDPAQAKEWAIKTAASLKSMGFNVNFAPVADVGLDSAMRMYSDDASVVTSFVEEAVKGYEAENMLCSLKHFPGIGRGVGDSHDSFVNVSADAETLRTTDFVPFKYMFDNSNQDNYWVMVTHVAYSDLDAENPASLSKVIMTDILRKDLGYQGIVITDDLDMGAIANYYDYNDVGVRAVLAGADMVMVCHEYEHGIAVYNGILQAVHSGQISQEQLDGSVRRIIKAKLQHIVDMDQQ